MEVQAWPDVSSAKLTVHELPQVWAPIPPEGGVLVSEAGRFARIIDDEPFRYLAYLEYLPAQTRGNHYHRSKQELLYITDGRLLAYYVDIDTHRSLELTLSEGHVVRTGPRLAHAYHALERSHTIEIAVQAFDPSDTVPYEVYPISDDPRVGREATELARELQLRDRIDASHRRAPVTTGGTGRAGRVKPASAVRSRGAGAAPGEPGENPPPDADIGAGIGTRGEAEEELARADAGRGATPDPAGRPAPGEGADRGAAPGAGHAPSRSRRAGRPESDPPARRGRSRPQ